MKFCSNSKPFQIWLVYDAIIRGPISARAIKTCHNWSDGAPRLKMFLNKSIPCPLENWKKAKIQSSITNAYLLNFEMKINGKPQTPASNSYSLFRPF